MIFPIPDPTFWNDPGPLPVSRFARWLWQMSGWPFFQISQPWVEQWRRYMERRRELEEEYAMWLEQQRAYEIMMAQYQEQGEYWCDRLPIWLHHQSLSYRRTVQDRKNERPYQKVDYCEIETWWFDEYAYYFWIQTWPLPYGVRISHFQPNASDDKPSEVAQTLAAAFGTNVTIEFNGRTHERPGLWIIAEHRGGRGAIPLHVDYQKMLAEVPKGAGGLAWPLGLGANRRMYLADLEEVHNLGIGGSVGGGKSNEINVILNTFINRNSPEDLRLFLVDFKRVELAFYRGLAHLGGDIPFACKITFDEDGKEKKGRIRTVKPDYEPRQNEKLFSPLGHKIITEGRDLIPLLDYLLAEIDRRTKLLEGKVKKISTWNKRYPHQKLSQWVLVIDELGDIMLRPELKKKVEERLVRIIQLGRAMGIRAIVATQTPKSSVITGLIQNNINAWVALRCGTGIASGLMLDGKWDAAKLPALPGRCIFREGGKMTEIQTPEITDLTIRSTVKSAREGTVASAVEKTYTISPDLIFQHALAELDGYCAEKDLYTHFRKQGVKLQEIRSILKEWQVAGAPTAFEPEIELGDDEQIYYLAPSPGGRNPRRLIKAEQFTAEFEEKWEEILARRTSPGAKNAGHLQGDIPKIYESFESEEADETLAEEIQEEYEAEFFNE